MTKLAIKGLHEVTGNFKDVDTVLVNRFELRRLQDQRDELLAALEKIATSVEIDTLRSAIECARAAIAKAEGEKS